MRLIKKLWRDIMKKTLDRNETFKCKCCGKELRQITQKHLTKCSNITVQDYKKMYPDAQLRTKWHSERIREYNRETKCGDNNPMKNVVHYEKMKRNQLKAVREPEYRAKVSKRQKENNNNPHIIGQKGPNAWNWKKPRTPEVKRKIRVATIKNRKKLGLSEFKPMYNLAACKIFDQIAERTGTKIQHGANGGEFHIEHLGYWVDGYDKENNIVYEYDEKHHFRNQKQIDRDLRRQKEIEDYLKCTVIRIRYDNTGEDAMRDIVDSLIEIKKVNNKSKIEYP